MKIWLSEIETGTQFKRRLSYDKRVLEPDAREIIVQGVVFNVEIHPDPQGYLMHYGLSGGWEVACSRCGDPVTGDIEVSEWMALRLRHPDQPHLVLSDADMNTKFLTSAELDLEKVVDELIDLEVPEFPRHDRCDSEAVMEPAEEPVATNQPFSKLSSLLQGQVEENRKGED